MLNSILVARISVRVRVEQQRLARSHATMVITIVSIDIETVSCRCHNTSRVSTPYFCVHTSIFCLF